MLKIGDHGATAVEFALIALVLLTLLGGMIDAGVGLHRYSLLTHITDSTARDLAVLAASRELGCNEVANLVQGTVEQRAKVLLGETSGLTASASFSGRRRPPGEFPMVLVRTRAPLKCILCSLLPDMQVSTDASAALQSGPCFQSLL